MAAETDHENTPGISPNVLVVGPRNLRAMGAAHRVLLQTYANVLCKIGPVNVCFAKVICKFAQMLDWQALRYVLAVGGDRALSEAAGRLGVNHSTVLSRMRRIEGNLSTRMLEKHRDG